MGFFLFINSFYTFSILFLKAAVSLGSLSHLPVTSDFHLLIYKSELGVIKAKHKVILLILNFTYISENHLEALCIPS